MFSFSQKSFIFKIKERKALGKSFEFKTNFDYLQLIQQVKQMFRKVKINF